MLHRFLRPSVGQPSRATLLARLAVGFVFVVSGITKLAFENQGALRFAKLGLPAPAALSTFVSTTEIVLGLAIAAGLYTRLASIPLAVDMVVAIATSKLPLLVGAGPEPIAAAPKTALLAFAYQSRLDLTMLGMCIYLAIVGAGLWSLDARLARNRWASDLDGGLRDGGARGASRAKSELLA